MKIGDTVTTKYIFEHNLSFRGTVIGVKYDGKWESIVVRWSDDKKINHYLRHELVLLKSGGGHPQTTVFQ